MTTTMTTTAIQELFAKMGAAWDANDAEAFAACYTDDASLVTTTGRANGRDEIRAFMTAGFAGRLAGTTSAERIERIRDLGRSDAAVVEAISAFRLPDRTEVERRATYTLARDGGDWRVAAYHNGALV